MKITVLGCGASPGVPLIGCDCAVCRSDNPKNDRSRVSILVEQGGTRILVDTSPDLRRQALNHRIHQVDAILYTHGHADHTHGIDDIRSFNYHKNAPIDCYLDAETLESIRGRFAYAFQEPIPEYGWFRPCLTPHIITPGKPFSVGGVEILPILQQHGGRSQSLSYRFGDFTYSTDVNGFPDESWEQLRGTKIWLVDCLRRDPAPTHAHLELSLEWIAGLQPEISYLTHMSHDLGYEKLCTELPAHIRPAYDGLTITL